MWALLSRRARRYALFAVAAPVAGVVLHRIGDELEARGEQTRLSRGVRSTADFVQQQGRGPFASRLRTDRDTG